MEWTHYSAANTESLKRFGMAKTKGLAFSVDLRFDPDQFLKRHFKSISFL